MRTRFAGVGLCCVMAVGAGCAQLDNDRLTDLTPGVPMAEATGPSVLGVSRANWADRVFLVEPAAVEHYPTYTALGPMSADATEAQRGCDPTAAGSFAAETDAGAQRGDGVAAPFIAGWEVLRMPVAMIARWPGSVTRDGSPVYDRYHEPTRTFDLGTIEESPE